MRNTIDHPQRGRLVCKIWDSAQHKDRYTIAFKAQRGLRGRLYWPYLAASENPAHPHGIGLHCESDRPLKGRHLGKRIPWESLPLEVQQFVLRAI